ncbi:uncharacterized protein BDZ83DRAFT_422904 [Colletotrichum acutatum]|uniref:Uncharacterized protein n=1 Tax=Glomerella acutata TaxID=27357 RepID=A0AAD8XML9_GLOAC|nr:uncharacterized protein BDZ83DRAFT_422904 [Colletotrichum acutatum]KAK1730092.1 hypothetical protein BDZ83DRAFT_422904 [Colletotrichum acutatum]
MPAGGLSLAFVLRSTIQDSSPAASTLRRARLELTDPYSPNDIYNVRLRVAATKARIKRASWTSTGHDGRYSIVTVLAHRISRLQGQFPDNAQPRAPEDVENLLSKVPSELQKEPPGPSFPSPAGPVWGNIAVPARADGRGLAVISCLFGCRGARIQAILSAPDNGGGDFVRVPCRRAKQNAPTKLHAANDYHDHGEDAGVICSCSARLLSFGPSVGRIFRGPTNFGP